DAVAARAEDFAELGLRAAAVAVDVGGVEQRDAEIERAVDHPARGVDGKRAEVVAAEADDRDLDARIAELALFHVPILRRLRSNASPSVGQAERGPGTSDIASVRRKKKKGRRLPSALSKSNQ